MTDKERAKAADAAFRKTTIAYPAWKRKVAQGVYPAEGPPSQWGIGFEQLAEIGLDVPPVVPPVEPPSTTDFYVSTAGSDTADGSQGSPFRSLRKACASVTVGTIHVAAGVYVETSTVVVPDGVSVVGAGSPDTVIRAASAFTPLMSVSNTTKAQTLSDFRLDGQSKTTSDYGLWVSNCRYLTITRIDGRGFKAPADHTGGALNVDGATDFVLSFSSFYESGGPGSGYCSGTLGLGNLVRADIHDLTVQTNAGYCVKATGGTTGKITDSSVYNCNFQIGALGYTGGLFCPPETAPVHWNQLCVEFFSTRVLNSRFHHNTLNGPLSLTGPNENTNIGSGGRWRIDHNHFQITSSNLYAIEADVPSSEIDHNWFQGGYYPIYQSGGQYTDAGLNIHHNVFDSAQSITAQAVNMEGLPGSQTFAKNTVVVRGNPPLIHDYQKGAAGVNMTANIFYATSPLGDRLGSTTGASIDTNVFRNITARGTNPTVGDPGLPLTGGFPAAYTPTSYMTFGAFADGVFNDVGAQ